MSTRPVRVTEGVSAAAATGRAAPVVSPCPHGPVLVRGAASVSLADGEVHLVDRPVVAVCRCEKSSSRPWCDSTHRSIPDY